MHNSWILESNRLLQENIDFVSVTIAQTNGSTPRNEGSKMLVTDKEQFGSIGGGKLELEATKLARRMLAEKQSEKLDFYEKLLTH